MKRLASHSAKDPRPNKLKKESTNHVLGIQRGSSVGLTRGTSMRQKKAPAWLSSYVTNNINKEATGKQNGSTNSTVSKAKLPRFPTLVPPSKRGKELFDKSKLNGKQKNTPKKEVSVTPLLKKRSSRMSEKPLPRSTATTKIKEKTLSRQVETSKAKEMKGNNRKTKVDEVVAPLLRKKSTVKLNIPQSPPVVGKTNGKITLNVTPSLKRKPTTILKPSRSSVRQTASSNTSNVRVVRPNSSTEVNPLSAKTKSKSQSQQSGKDLSITLMKRVKLKVPVASKKSSLSNSPSSPQPGKKPSISRLSSKRTMKEDSIPDSKVVELCNDPMPTVLNGFKPDGPILSTVKDVETVSNCSDVTPTLPLEEDDFVIPDSYKRRSPPPVPFSHGKTVEQTLILPPPAPVRPNMLEVVICISTSGSMRQYLQALKDNIRDIIWRLQSLVTNVRIGILSHTQGGIYDSANKASPAFSSFNQSGPNHSGTKWLDLGATLSQICAFVHSLESESTVYPDYVQDNLEMALWKMQRCMTWSSCSYRSAIMIGRQRPNRTSFYTQKEHWRGWIRSSLELPLNKDIPVIDWELETKLLAQMGIHVFTVQATSGNLPATNKDEQDEGTAFFRRVAEITHSQHISISEPVKLPEIVIGICCACHGSDMLMDHRETVRDENDGVLPTQLTDVFIGLQLHSKTYSLSSLPTMLGSMGLSSIPQKLAANPFPRQPESLMECKSVEVEKSMELGSLESSMSVEMSSLATEETMETEHRPKAKNLVRHTKLMVKPDGSAVSKTDERWKPYSAGRSRVASNSKSLADDSRCLNNLNKRAGNLTGMKDQRVVSNGRAVSGNSGASVRGSRSVGISDVKLGGKRAVKLTEKMRDSSMSVGVRTGGGIRGGRPQAMQDMGSKRGRFSNVSPMNRRK